MQAHGPKPPVEEGRFRWESAGNCKLFSVHSLALTFTPLEGLTSVEHSQTGFGRAAAFTKTAHGLRLGVGPLLRRG